MVRVEVRPDGDSVIIVRKGEVQISTPKGIADVKEGEMATVRGQVEEAQYKIVAAPDRDDWDMWNSERDHIIHSANAWQHTSPYYTGAEDLDAYGNWENVPTTDRFGCQTNRMDGPPIGMAIGSGNRTTVGPGLGTSRGVGRHTTMAAGCRTAARGGGGRDRFGERAFIVRSGHRLTCRSLASVEVLALASVLVGADGVVSVGCRSDRVIGSTLVGRIWRSLWLGRLWPVWRIWPVRGDRRLFMPDHVLERGAHQ